MIATLQDQGYKTHDPATGRPYAIVLNIPKTWIMQRISTALMQGNAACVHDRLTRIQADQTPWQLRHVPGLTQAEFRHG